MAVWCGFAPRFDGDLNLLCFSARALFFLVWIWGALYLDVSILSRELCVVFLLVLV